MLNSKSILFLLFFCQFLIGCLPSSDNKNSNLQTPEQLHSINIHWIPVTENQDNKTISNITGYKIRYGTHPNNYTDSIEVHGQSTNMATIPQLVPNNYYVSMTALLSSGIESNYSPEHTILVSN
jgi:hypothetical protein